MFNCKPYLKECKGGCCYNIGFPLQKYRLLKSRVITPVVKLVKVKDKKGQVVLITNTDIEKNKCPFQKKDYSCNIYEYRPHICKIFGQKDHRYLQCPMQDLTGKKKIT